MVGQSLDGNITGYGPENPSQRNAWLEDHQPYSIRIGDKWVSYQRVDPMATIVGTAADLGQLYKDSKDQDLGLGEVPGRLAMIMAHNLSSKTFLRGIVDFGNAVMRPQESAESWAQSAVGSLIPSGVSQLARSMDPTLHETRSIVDAAMNRLPGLREKLPVKIDPMTGEEITLGGSVGPDFVSPFYTKEAGIDPVAQKMVDLRVGVSRPERGDLTPEEYDKLQRESGKTGHASAVRLIARPFFAHMSPEDQADKLTGVYRAARSMARKRIIFERSRSRGTRK